MCWTGVRRRVWGLSGRLIASCTLVTFAVVVLLVALVLGYQAPQLVNDAQQQAQVIATAQSYSQQLAQRYPGGVPAGTLLGDPAFLPEHGGKAGMAQPDPYGSTLTVPAITGPIYGHQAVTAVAAVAADGTIVVSSAPSAPAAKTVEEASRAPLSTDKPSAGHLNGGRTCRTPG